MSLIIKAARFADLAHRGQMRKATNVPYITHVIRVAGRVATLHGATEAMVAAAFLHDVIEDCAVSFNTIKQQFGDEVASLVLTLTSYSKQIEQAAEYSGSVFTLPNRAARKELDRQYLKTVSEETKRIKMVDRLDNLYDTLQEADAKWAIKYVEESEHLWTLALEGIDSEMDAEFKALAIAIKEKYKQ